MKNQLLLSESKLFDRQKLIAIALLFLAAVGLSFAAIFIKWSEIEISPNATVFNRLWIATVVLGFGNTLNFVYLKLSNRQLNIQSVEDTPYTKTVILLLLGLGFSYLGFQSLWAWSITQTSIGISTVLHNFTPIFTTLSAWIFFGQRFEEKFLIGMVITIAGIVFIGIGDIQIANGTNNKMLGDVAALFSAVFYAGYLLIIEQLRSKLSATKILMWSSLTGAILILPILIVTGEKIFPYSSNGWLAVISLAVISQVLGQGLVTYSLDKLSAGFVALFLLLDPVLTAIEAWIIFSERLSLLDWIAFVLVLLGIYLALSSKSSIQQE
ncbi:MAG: DMT family transporter [Cyanobacteria bacterium P01_H01_bin.35]